MTNKAGDAIWFEVRHERVQAFSGDDPSRGREIAQACVLLYGNNDDNFFDRYANGYQFFATTSRDARIVSAGVIEFFSYGDSVAILHAESAEPTDVTGLISALEETARIRGVAVVFGHPTAQTAEIYEQCGYEVDLDNEVAIKQLQVAEQ